MLVKSRRAGWRLGIALVAAYLLVLQSVFGAFALGIGPQQLDAFGNPLCIGSGDHSGSGKTDHGSLPNCCTLGCPMVGQTLGAPPQVSWLPASPPLDVGAVTHVPPVVVVSADDHRPGNPRAPPHHV